MGANFAHDLASGDFGLSLQDAVRIHLTANHYPPLPTSLVPVCVNAIDLANDGFFDIEMVLPTGVSWRGNRTIPVGNVIEEFHLDAFVFFDDEE